MKRRTTVELLKLSCFVSVAQDTSGTRMARDSKGLSVRTMTLSDVRVLADNATAFFYKPTLFTIRAGGCVNQTRPSKA